MSSHKRLAAAFLFVICATVLLFLLRGDSERGGHGDGIARPAPSMSAVGNSSAKTLPESDTAPVTPSEPALEQGVSLDLKSGGVILSTGSGVDAVTAAEVNAGVRKAFAQMEEIDSRHSEVVPSNLRSDVVIIGKAGEEGQRIKRELEARLATLLASDRHGLAEKIVKEIGSLTGDFGSRFRAVYTQPVEGGGYKFTIGSFNDSLVSDYEAFKAGGAYRDISNARTSTSFTSAEPPFFLKRYFE